MTPKMIREVYEKALAQQNHEDGTLRLSPDHALIAVFNAGRQFEREVQATFAGVS